MSGSCPISAHNWLLFVQLTSRHKPVPLLLTRRSEHCPSSVVPSSSNNSNQNGGADYYNQLLCRCGGNCLGKGMLMIGEYFGTVDSRVWIPYCEGQLLEL